MKVNRMVEHYSVQHGRLDSSVCAEFRFDDCFSANEMFMEIDDALKPGEYVELAHCYVCRAGYQRHVEKFNIR